MPLYKLVASQAKCIYSFKNLREKVQRCCASIYFNRQCHTIGIPNVCTAPWNLQHMKDLKMT